MFLLVLDTVTEVIKQISVDINKLTAIKSYKDYFVWIYRNYDSRNAILIFPVLCRFFASWLTICFCSHTIVVCLK